MAKIDPADTSQDEWSTVSEEFPTRVNFKVGDTFIGTFKGTEQVEAADNDGKPFSLYLFEKDGERYTISKHSRLRNAMKLVRPGNLVRIECVAEIPTSQANPMLDFVVSVRKS